jgi:hypothetical protein
MPAMPLLPLLMLFFAAPLLMPCHLMPPLRQRHYCRHYSLFSPLFHYCFHFMPLRHDASHFIIDSLSPHFMPFHYYFRHYADIITPLITLSLFSADY